MLPGDVVTLVCGVIYACDLTAVAWFSKGRDPILLTTMQITFSAVIGWIGTILTNGMPEAEMSCIWHCFPQPFACSFRLMA